MNIKSWIEAARLRTLPLSLSGIFLGSFIALKQGYWNTWIFVLALFSTLFFQILSNFANDLGDSYKGADNEHRVGPIRGLQAGLISRKAMIIGIVVVTVLSLLSAIPLVIIGTHQMPSSVLWFYLLLALLCILAAITYTVGKKAYGYNGLGDLMVFLFFGLVSVIGVYCLYAKHFDISVILPACSIGLLSTAVINLNNMRDVNNDERSGKRTVVVLMGIKKAKIYHTSLLLLSLVLLLIFIIIKQWWWSLIALLPYFVLFSHVKKVWKTKIAEGLDVGLKVVSLSTFGIAVLFLISTLL